MTWYNPADAEIGDTLYLSSPYGWNSSTVSEWKVVRKTPKGQVVCKRGDREMRLTPSGHIVGSGAWSRESFVSAERAAEIRTEEAERNKWRAIERAAEELQKAARNRDTEAANAAFAALAQGMPAMPETRSGSAPKEGQPGPAKQDAP